MMTALRFAIVTEIAARLSALSIVAEVQINAAGDPSQFPALFIDDAGHLPDEGTEPGSTRYEMNLTIEGYVKGGGGEDAYADLNTLYLAVVGAVLIEPPLDGLAEEINEGPMRIATAILSKERRLGFSMDLKISFVADRASPVAP